MHISHRFGAVQPVLSHTLSASRFALGTVVTNNAPTFGSKRPKQLMLALALATLLTHFFGHINNAQDNKETDRLGKEVSATTKGAKVLSNETTLVWKKADDLGKTISTLEKEVAAIQEKRQAQKAN